MTGLEVLAMYLDIFKKYFDIKGVKFTIDKFENKNPIIVHILEKDDSKKILTEYDVYCSYNDGVLKMVNANDEDIFDLLKKEQKISDSDMKTYIDEIYSILKSHL